MKITFTRNAHLDLKNIAGYIKDKSSDKAARAFRKRIFDKVKYLKTFPQMEPIDEKYNNLSVETRFLVEGNYKIYYQVTDHVIFILRVADTRQSP